MFHARFSSDLVKAEDLSLGLFVGFWSLCIGTRTADFSVLKIASRTFYLHQVSGLVPEVWASGQCMPFGGSFRNTEDPILWTLFGHPHKNNTLLTLTP
jgi:hypothetical protein